MKIQIFSADIGWSNAKQCHDYWIRQNISASVNNSGYTTVPFDSNVVPDIQLTIWGMKPLYEIKAEGRFRALWLHSVRYGLPKSCEQYDQIYTRSSIHQQRIRQEGVDSKILPIASDKEYVPKNQPYKYDIVFMGTHREHRVKIIKLLADQGYKIAIAGVGWHKLQHTNVDVLKDFWPNDDFSSFYNLAPLSVYELQDVHEEYGITPTRALDIYKCSDCLCIMRENNGIKEDFPIMPPVYSSDKELLRHVSFYLGHPRSRRKKQKDIRESLRRKYRHLVSEIISDAESFWKRRQK